MQRVCCVTNLELLIEQSSAWLKINRKPRQGGETKSHKAWKLCFEMDDGPEEEKSILWQQQMKSFHTEWMLLPLLSPSQFKADKVS